MGLLAGLLHPDPSVRLSPAEALAHPFFLDQEELPVACLGYDGIFSVARETQISRPNVSECLYDSSVRRGLESLHRHDNNPRVMLPSIRSLPPNNRTKMMKREKFGLKSEPSKTPS